MTTTREDAMNEQTAQAYARLVKLECALSQCPRRRAGYAALARDVDQARAEYEALRAAEDAAETDEQVTVWDVDSDEIVTVPRAEAAAGMMRYARSLGPGSPACGEMERKAMAVLHGEGTAAEDAEPGPVACRRCRRPLRSEASRAAGIGPRCAALEAAFEGLNGKQAGKALEVLADGGVVRVRPGVYRVSATSGEESYLCTLDGHCSCRWGNCRVSALSKTCYHAAAARLAARPRIRPAKAAGSAAAAPFAMPAGIRAPHLPDDVWGALEAMGALDEVPAF